MTPSKQRITLRRWLYEHPNPTAEHLLRQYDAECEHPAATSCEPSKQRIERADLDFVEQICQELCEHFENLERAESDGGGELWYGELEQIVKKATLAADDSAAWQIAEKFAVALLDIKLLLHFHSSENSKLPEIIEVLEKALAAYQEVKGGVE